MNYWIMKSEPDEFSILDLEKKNIATWDGIRNYQVRNMLRDDMKVGDLAYFYHSSCKHIGIAGIMSIHSQAFIDPSALDKKSKYFDPKANKEKNPWLAIDVQFISKFPHLITRQDLENTSKLKNLKILQKGCRLSITPISKNEFEIIKQLNFSL